MMAEMLWPNCFFITKFNANQFSDGYNSMSTEFFFSILPFSKARTRAINRIGPHNIDVLSILICGMLGDWWSHLIPGRFFFF